MPVQSAALASFSINLSYLLSGGVSLPAALTLLKQSEPSSQLNQLIDDICQAVQSGSMLSAAMGNHASVFSEVSIALVTAAEHDGTLADSFREIANLINKEAVSRDRMRNAMAYPLLLSVAVILTLVFMIAYLTPAVKPLLLSVGATPGPTTQVLFWLASEGAIAVGLLMVLPIWIGVFYLLSHFNASVRYHWHRHLLLIWIVGDVRRDILYARLCRIVARLLDSGSTIDEALAIASNSIDNVFIGAELNEMRLQMQVGNRFSQSIRGLTTAPMILEPLMNAAESSGDVAPALHRVAQQLDEQAAAMLARFTTLAPPILVLLLGFVLLALVVGLLGPIFSSAVTMGATL